MPPRKKASTGEPTTPLWTVCPFTGLPEVKFVQLSNGKYQVRGPNWICTHFFDSLYSAQLWAGHRNGVEPAGLQPPTKIEVVGERMEPDGDPTADLRDNFEKAANAANETF